MDKLKLCETDYKFMTAIWDNEPLPSGQLVKICKDLLGWKKPTTYTTLRKLCQRGLAKNENTIVTSLVPREEVQVYASNRFMSNTFDGSLPSFLVAFLDGKKLSNEESEELKRLIDEHKEG